MDKISGFCTEDLIKAIAEFVKYYNDERYHESLRNLTPTDVYFGRDKKILQERSRIKETTFKERIISFGNWNWIMKIIEISLYNRTLTYDLERCNLV